MDHVRAVQRMKTDRLVELMYATRKTRKGSDVHLNAWTFLEFQRESQDDVCLTAFGVCEEEDFSHRRAGTLRYLEWGS